MGLSFFNQQRARQKVKNSSSDITRDILSVAKDVAPSPIIEEESPSLDLKPIEDVTIQQEEIKPKISDAQKIKNAKNKAQNSK